ncbi:MAG: tRNA lysidine(34) synthetase TilS [Gemmatimonadota bacterium]
MLTDDPTLIPAGARVLIALSGGGDSVALLHLLVREAGPQGFALHAAHFDHGLREGSRAEAVRIRRMAEGLGVPCTVGRANDLPRNQGAYRRARMQFLEDTADRVGADRIALGHQLEDQVETVVLRLLRGTGLRGLRGIPVRRDRFVRPLLGIRRDRLRKYLTAQGSDWIEDESNVDPSYTRSRVRHDILPMLRSAAGRAGGSPRNGPGLDESLLALSDGADCSDRALDARAVREMGPDAHVLAEPSDGAGRGAQIARFELADYDLAVVGRFLRIAARYRGFRLSRGGTRLGVGFIRCASSGQAVDLGGGLRLTREYDWFRLYEVDHDPTPDRELTIRSAEAGTGTATLGGCVYEVEWGTESAEGSQWVVDLDTDVVVFPLRLRGPRPGDRIRARVGSRKLKKLLNERRVPRGRRDRTPILEGADGRILWVAGHEAAAMHSRADAPELFSVGVVGTDVDGH